MELKRISSSLSKTQVRATINSILVDLEGFNIIDEDTQWHGKHVATDLEQAEYLSNPIDLKLGYLVGKY